MLSHIRIGAAVLFGGFVLFCVVSIQKLVESVAASDYVVIQAPLDGTLTWYTQPGIAWQGFGDVTTYHIRTTYDFRDTGYLVQFNDGGHGAIKGSIQCDLPSDHKLLTELHRKYPSQEQVENGLIKTATQNALYLVGPLMSSRESYAEKKNDLTRYVMDMVEFGPYRTRQVHQWVKDPVTGQDKEVTGAEIMMDKNGMPERQETSAISTFGIKCYQFTINKIEYDPIVDAQIKQQQKITMDVQTSLADKVLAEQRAQTAEANGRASATEAKWKQETIKATEVTRADQEKQVAIIAAEQAKQVAETKAQQELAVAQLDKQAAEQTKQKLILLGEGSAEQKKLILAADGNMQMKLDTWLKAQQAYATALHGANLVPSVVMGGGATGPGGATAFNAQDLLGMIGVKAAKDLALDMSIRPGMTPTPVNTK